MLYSMLDIFNLIVIYFQCFQKYKLYKIIGQFMYDFKPKFSQKLSSNNSLHHPSNSLPKLTITADNSPEKISSINPRKLTTKSHNFLQLFSLHKSYLCSTKVKSNRNMEKSPNRLSIGSRSVKNNNCGKNINLDKNNESQLKCRDYREDDL